MKRVSDLATEREILEFFSFSGDIEHIEIRRSACCFLPFFLFELLSIEWCFLFYVYLLVFAESQGSLRPLLLRLETPGRSKSPCCCR